MKLASAVALLLAVPTTLIAQADSAGPRAGAWAAEVTFGGSASGAGGTLLRFRTDRSAWLLGLTAQVARRDRNEPFDDEDGTHGAVGARLGLRSYRSPGSALRPVVGVGILGTLNAIGGNQEFWDAGIYGEMGAMRFFGPSVSLGATAEVQVRHAVQRFSTQRITETGLAFDAVRVHAAVYF